VDSSSALKKSDASLLLSKLYRTIISARTPESTSFHTDRRLTLIVRCRHVPNGVNKLTLTQRNVGISMACAGRSCLRSSCAAIPRALTGWCYVEAVSNYVPTAYRSGLWYPVAASAGVAIAVCRFTRGMLALRLCSVVGNAESRQRHQCRRRQRCPKAGAAYRRRRRLIDVVSG
jgi:hypothetical protein